MDTNQSDSGVGVTDVCKTCGLPKFTDMVQMQAEIEHLKAELAAETQRRWDGNRIASDEAAEELAASQAREAKLREFCNFAYRDVPMNDYASEKLDEVLALPSDDSALKEAIKQGQREILLKAADTIEHDPGDAGWLRRMEDEIK